MEKNINLGIVGHGFVGKAVDSGFVEGVHKIIVDPKYDDVGPRVLLERPVKAIFICVPTPALSSGKVNDSILLDVVKEIASLIKKDRPLIIVKSTAPPTTFENLKRIYPRLIYNPEFLRERSAVEDFLNPPVHIFGGDSEDLDEVEMIYREYSSCAICPVYKTDIKTASLLKYTINSFLATKVIFFNQLKDLHTTCGAQSTWEEFIKMVSCDERIGSSHMHVPGPDGEWGYGGSCFPKDTRAFVHYANSQQEPFDLLERVVNLNEKYRQK